MSTQTPAVATLESEEVAKAYAEIADFFDCYAIIHARKCLTAYLKAVISPNSWEGQNPANIIYFFEMMEKLRAAAWVLVQSGM